MYRCTRCKELSVGETPQTQMILARHGEADLNRNGICVGGIDPPLNVEGQRQARVIAFNLNFNGYKIGSIQSSPLVRAKRTAEIIGEKLGFNGCRRIIIDTRLRERDAGILRDKPVRDGNVRELFNYSRTPPEGEPLEFFDKRVAEFLRAFHSGFSGMNGLIVTHSHVILSILKFAYGWTNKDLLSHELPRHDQLWKFWIWRVCWNCNNFLYEKTED